MRGCSGSNGRPDRLPGKEGSDRPWAGRRHTQKPPSIVGTQPQAAKNAKSPRAAGRPRAERRRASETTGPAPAEENRAERTGPERGAAAMREGEGEVRSVASADRPSVDPVPPSPAATISGASGPTGARRPAAASPNNSRGN